MVQKVFKIYVVLLLLFYLPAAVHSQLWEKVTKKERSTFSEMQQAANKFYESMKEGRKPGFKQFKRWEWFARNRLDKDGYFNPALNWNGWLEKEERFGPADSSSNWTPVGPAALPRPAGSGSGLGRLNCIAFDPHNTDIIWVGAPTGGLWKSTNSGQAWATFTDYLPNLGVSDIVIHPGNSNIMYIATGDKQRGSTLSVGVMKSLDGGLTWQLTGLNPGVEEKNKIGHMLMHPENPETLLAASNKGIYKTINGGDTWIIKEAGDFFDIEVNPANPSTWYASRAGFGVYRSMDSGEKWTRLTNGLPMPGPRFGRIVIAVSKSVPNILYAVYAEDIESEGWIWGLYGVYRSMDGGDTWTLQSNSPNLLGWELDGSDAGGQGGYALVLDVNPSDPNTLFVGSVNLWRSSDGGVNWQIIARNVHVDHHDLVFLPGSPAALFSCNDGGLYKSENNGDSWTDLSSGLAIQQVYRLGLSTQDPYHVVVGAQDNGSEILNGSEPGWRSVYGGDGADCMIDPNDNSIIYCASQWGNFLRSRNGGAGFMSIFTSREGAYAWMAPIVMAPDDPLTLYTASNRVFKSTDRGSRARVISPVLTVEPLRVLVVAPSNPNCFVTTDGTRLFKTLNSGTDWTELDTSMFPTFITDIGFHPFTHETLWVTIGGFGRWNSRFTWNNIPYEIDKAKVFQSKDGGVTWTDVSGQLPNIPANCIVTDPRTAEVYVGTDLGVFYSATGQGDWKRFDNGLPNVIVTDMEIQTTAGKIVAATYGRGVWESPLASPPAGPRIYPPMRFTARWEINRSLFQTEFISILNWAPNPLNENNNITAYRIYQVSGNSRTALADLPATPGLSQYEYVRRRLASGTYQYALAVVDGNGNESEALKATIRVNN